MAKPRARQSTSRTTTKPSPPKKPSPQTSKYQPLVTKIAPPKPLARNKSTETILSDFDISVSTTVNDVLTIYETALQELTSEEEDFRNDVSTWFNVFKEEQLSITQAQKSNFSQLKPLAETLLEKMEKHGLLAQNVSEHHYSALDIHNKESGQFMDETNSLFTQYKTKFNNEIERKTKETTVTDVTEKGVVGTPRNVKFVRGLGKLMEMMDVDSAVKNEEAGKTE